MERRLPARAPGAEIRAPARLLAGGVELDMASGGAHDADQLALRAHLAADDTRTLRHVARTLRLFGLLRRRLRCGHVSHPPDAYTSKVAAAVDSLLGVGCSSGRTISMRQPVSRAASRAFCPRLPIASESCRSGTITNAVWSDSRNSTEIGFTGLSAFATNFAGSGSHRIMSIFS